MINLAVATHFKVLCYYLPTVTKENHEKLGITCLLSEIRIWNLPNTRQMC